MSSDEAFVLVVLAALRAARLEAVVVGNTAAVLQGVPVTTQDVDLLVRDTPKNREKIAAFAEALGGRVIRLSDLAEVLTVVGGRVPVDLILDRLPGPRRFASVKARAHALPIGEEVALVADLADVIASKEAADREKDRAVLPTLRAALAVARARGERD